MSVRRLWTETMIPESGVKNDMAAWYLVDDQAMEGMALVASWAGRMERDSPEGRKSRWKDVRPGERLLVG